MVPPWTTMAVVNSFSAAFWPAYVCPQLQAFGITSSLIHASKAVCTLSQKAFDLHRREPMVPPLSIHADNPDAHWVPDNFCIQILRNCTPETRFCYLTDRRKQNFGRFPASEHRTDINILNILIRRSTFMDIFYNTVRDKTQISGFFVGNLYSREKIHYLLFHTKNDIVIRNYILDMYREQKTGDSFSDRIICSILTLFFVKLTRRHGKKVSIPDNRRERTEQESEMLAYMMRNCSTVTLNELAEKFHFSVPYCSNWSNLSPEKLSPIFSQRSVCSKANSFFSAASSA